MGTTLKKISEGDPYHVRFLKTTIYKRIFGKEEIKIDEYYFQNNDEYYSEIIWMVPFGRGPLTWFNFNKVERMEKIGVIDYHKNIFMGDFKFHQQKNIEYIVSEAADGQPINLTIQKNTIGYMADILITYPNWYFRIHLEDPISDIFED